MYSIYPIIPSIYHVLRDVGIMHAHREHVLREDVHEEEERDVVVM